MKLLLIRHGETIDNAAGLIAGITDSPLTVHGSLQVNRLAIHVAESKYKLTHIFSSDLQRARKTAEALYSAQQEKYGAEVMGVDLTEVLELREQDFGSLEKQPFGARMKMGAGTPRTREKAAVSASAPATSKAQTRGAASYRAVETKESMSARADRFLDVHLLPILLSRKSDKEPKVAVVSHGMLLSTLWKSLLKRFALHSVMAAPDHLRNGDAVTSLERLGPWSNTGYLELHIKKMPTNVRKRAAHVAEIATAPSSSMPRTKANTAPKKLSVLYDWMIEIKSVNSKDHLRGLKRTGGGVGSSKFSEDQKTIEMFFKKQRVR